MVVCMDSPLQFESPTMTSRALKVLRSNWHPLFIGFLWKLNFIEVYFQHAMHIWARLHIGGYIRTLVPIALSVHASP